MMLSLSLPATAQTAYGCGQSAGGCGSCADGLLAGAAYAVVAVLGYWVLLQAAKESGLWVKRIGNALAGVLMIAGVLGLLCALTCHSKSSANRSCAGPGPGMMPPPHGMGMGMNPGMMPPGHPPIGDMGQPDAGARKGGKAK
ncbi:MAG: hypothetical protein HY926_00240 [Elusimicrobia bacterium]|nr:hypothetical protein [Elusimicrobiota bacterium]